MTIQSQRNHYIPVFYLKNFTNVDGHFWVYDKLSPWSRPLQYRSPIQVCFEWDRNYIYGKNGEVSDVLESSTYSSLDNRHAKTFEKLANHKDGKFDWTLDVHGDLRYFIPLLYWRSTIGDKKIAKKIQAAKHIDEFGISMHAGDEHITDEEFHREILNDQNINKAIRPSLTMLSFSGESHPVFDELEWRMVAWQENDYCIVSDNPIIFKEDPHQPQGFRGSLILPLSNHKALVRVDERAGWVFHTTGTQNLLQFGQAERFVMCASKPHLENVVKAYQRYVDSGGASLTRDIFKTYEHI